MIDDDFNPVIDVFHSQTATTTLSVSITDINDNSPQFVGDTSFRVRENLGNEFIGAVQATDADAGVNAQVTYEVLSQRG